MKLYNLSSNVEAIEGRHLLKWLTENNLKHPLLVNCLAVKKLEYFVELLGGAYGIVEFANGTVIHLRPLDWLLIFPYGVMVVSNEDFKKIEQEYTR